LFFLLLQNLLRFIELFLAGFFCNCVVVLMAECYNDFVIEMAEIREPKQRYALPGAVVLALFMPWAPHLF
jgi:hypothetical protein